MSKVDSDSGTDPTMPTLVRVGASSYNPIAKKQRPQISNCVGNYSRQHICNMEACVEFKPNMELATTNKHKLKLLPLCGLHVLALFLLQVATCTASCSQAQCCGRKLRRCLRFSGPVYVVHSAVSAAVPVLSPELLSPFVSSTSMSFAPSTCMFLATSLRLASVVSPCVSSTSSVCVSSA